VGGNKIRVEKGETKEETVNEQGGERLEDE